MALLRIIAVGRGDSEELPRPQRLGVSELDGEPIHQLTPFLKELKKYLILLKKALAIATKYLQRQPSKL